MKEEMDEADKLKEYIADVWLHGVPYDGVSYLSTTLNQCKLF
jgi:hypothetical protein